MVAPMAEARIAILAVFDRLLFAVGGNCCGRGATLPAFASFINFSMSVFNFVLALLASFAAVSLSSTEVPGSLFFGPSANTDVEQTQSATASTSGSAKSLLVISSSKRFLKVSIAQIPPVETAAKFGHLKENSTNESA